MKVLGTMVLIEQTMTKKVSPIIRAGGKKQESFDTKFKVLQVGAKCPKDGAEDYEGIEVGVSPIFSTHVTFHGAKPIGEVKSPNGTEVISAVIHTMVDYGDIIAIE